MSLEDAPTMSPSLPAALCGLICFNPNHWDETGRFTLRTLEDLPTDKKTVRWVKEPKTFTAKDRFDKITGLVAIGWRMDSLDQYPFMSGKV